ncbi:unnamed protein product [Prorocentrum cordatum]|uniref:Endonuclease/exonuclease/phosphatase domain-containing protein n=1 Tax=Prorocentrum cordatum TaxID=2364126 RepID=A0ABN9W0A3_9DINO|nr:unnamed protein product [Polarella glacialis]
MTRPSTPRRPLRWEATRATRAYWPWQGPCWALGAAAGRRGAAAGEWWHASPAYVDTWLRWADERRMSLFVSPRTGARPDACAILLAENVGIRDVNFTTLSMDDWGDRVIQVVRFRTVGGTSWAVANTHLSFPHGGELHAAMRRNQGRKLRDVLLSLKVSAEAVVLGGDFNGAPQDPVVQTVAQGAGLALQHVDEATHRDHRGRLISCDFILSHGLRPLGRSLEGPAGCLAQAGHFCSDHRPLLALVLVPMPSPLPSARGESLPAVPRAAAAAAARSPPGSPRGAQHAPPARRAAAALRVLASARARAGSAGGGGRPQEDVEATRDGIPGELDMEVSMDCATGKEDEADEVPVGWAVRGAVSMTSHPASPRGEARTSITIEARTSITIRMGPASPRSEARGPREQRTSSLRRTSAVLFDEGRHTCCCYGLTWGRLAEVFTTPVDSGAEAQTRGLVVQAEVQGPPPGSDSSLGSMARRFARHCLSEAKYYPAPLLFTLAPTIATSLVAGPHSIGGLVDHPEHCASSTVGQNMLVYIERTRKHPGLDEMISPLNRIFLWVGFAGSLYSMCRAWSWEATGKPFRWCVMYPVIVVCSAWVTSIWVKSQIDCATLSMWHIIHDEFSLKLFDPVIVFATFVYLRRVTGNISLDLFNLRIRSRDVHPSHESHHDR